MNFFNYIVSSYYDLDNNIRRKYLMNDEQYYRIINDEIKENRINEAIWLKALVEANRDVERAKIIYIKLRISQMKSEDLAKFGKELGRKINDKLESIDNWLIEHTPEQKITTINISARIISKGIINSFKDSLLDQGAYCSVVTSEIELATKHGNISIPTDTITRIRIIPKVFGSEAEISTIKNGNFRGKLITRYLEVNYKDGVTYSGEGLDLRKITSIDGYIHSDKIKSKSELPRNR